MAVFPDARKTRRAKKYLERGIRQNKQALKEGVPSTDEYRYVHRLEVYETCLVLIKAYQYHLDDKKLEGE